ncbi:uncharacterized protein LOC128674713 [Plodia interpunctella]|uniref:uncharacterized protein LOC128674713 n=1 Tax=Plodia interpunctella TaxID=58824 RepID=UPI002367DEB0|nr:uncharacterized protein LOC128674713 [Plodia interpunctella]
MNNRVILLVACGLVSALADPTTKQKVPTDNNQPLSQSTGEEAKHQEQLFNKSDSEQRNEVTNTNDQIREDGDAIFQIYVEETIDPVEEHYPQMQNELSIDDDTFTILDREDLNRDEVMESNTDEIMQTAAGFIPVPIIKKFRQKQPARRRVAARRQYRRPQPHPHHWRYSFPYVYYSYYRPSSLRYSYY